MFINISQILNLVLDDWSKLSLYNDFFIYYLYKGDQFISFPCKLLMYCIASIIISSCEVFPDCCRSGNNLFSCSKSSCLIVVVSTITSPSLMHIFFVCSSSSKVTSTTVGYWLKTPSWASYNNWFYKKIPPFNCITLMQVLLRQCGVWLIGGQKSYDWGQHWQWSIKWFLLGRVY